MSNQESRVAPSPIADLSYRHYDGPLDSPTLRWWVIARQGLRVSLKKRSLWVFTLLSGWYYLVMIGVLFVMDRITSGAPGSGQFTSVFLKRLVWKDQFLHGFSFAQLLLLMIALLVGAGAISNDNRAKALLVYLSKPCTKLDYAIGKWMGVFLTIFMALAIPTITYYLYGAMSYRELGFIRDEPWLLPKLLCIITLSASLHTSIVLAISSLFDQGRIAGAVYAGLYFVGNFFTVFMKAAWVLGHGKAPAFVKLLSYCSVDGLQIGLAKAILNTDGTPPFGAPVAPRMSTVVPAPSLGLFLLIVFGITFACLGLVWQRVRAVEVVG